MWNGSRFLLNIFFFWCFFGVMNLENILFSFCFCFCFLVRISEAGDDLYELLGIEKNADDRTIRKAFKKLALQYHPDKNKVRKKNFEWKFENFFIGRWKSPRQIRQNKSRLRNFEGWRIAKEVRSFWWKRTRSRVYRRAKLSIVVFLSKQFWNLRRRSGSRNFKSRGFRTVGAKRRRWNLLVREFLFFTMFALSSFGPRMAKNGSGNRRGYSRWRRKLSRWMVFVPRARRPTGILRWYSIRG